MGVTRGLFAPQFPDRIPGMIAIRAALVFLPLVLAGAAAAQEAPATGGALIGRIFDATGLRHAPPPPSDFVRQSRPEQLDYVPLAPAAETKGRRSAADMQALGAELDTAIAANRAKAARVKTPDAAPPARHRR